MYEGFGEFDLETVRGLESAGVAVWLGTARAAELPEAPEGAVLSVVRAAATPRCARSRTTAATRRPI